MRVARTQTDGAIGGLLHTTPAQWHRYQRLVVYLVRRVPLRTSPRCCPFTHHEGTAANRQPPRSTATVCLFPPFPLRQRMWAQSVGR